MGKFSLKGLKGGLKGVGGKVKILGGKAKVKGKDWLKEKWTGKLQSSSQPPKKDLLADMPVTAGTFLAAGGREPEKKEEKPSILGGIKEGLGKGVSKYKCRHCGTETWARKGSGPDKEQLCVKCYQQYMAQLPASMGGKWTEPETAKKPGSGPTVEQKEEAMERIREEHTGAKRIGFNTSNIGKKIGGIIASGIMMAAAYGEAFLYFPEFAQLVLIVGGIALAFIIISMFVKNAGGYLFLGFIAVSGFALWQLGILTPFIDQYLPPVADAFQNMWSLGSDVWFNTQCILSNPANAQTCMEARQRNATESVNKLGPYETVELKWGRRLDGSYDTDPVESGQDYTLDVSFFNKNNAVYEINFTEINASTTITVGSNPPVGYSTTPKSAFTGGRYTLDPKEELPIRFKEFDFPDDWPCVGSQTFKVNATTEQKSGGWSDFGIAPSDEGDFRKFIHGFKPNINAEPGPLNIYVYTDPWGIDASEFPSTIAPEDRAEVIIKIQNKVKSGIAKIDDLYLVQEFEVPDNLFDILEGTCEGTKALTQGTNGNLTVDTTLPSGLCSSTWNNCLRFHFPNTLILKPNDKITISCEINLDPNILTTLTNEYTDQIRVFANFRYTQEWTNPIPCLTYV